MFPSASTKSIWFALKVTTLACLTSSSAFVNSRKNHKCENNREERGDPKSIKNMTWTGIARLIALVKRKTSPWLIRRSDISSRYRRERRASYFNWTSKCWKICEGSSPKSGRASSKMSLELACKLSRVKLRSSTLRRIYCGRKISASNSTIWESMTVLKIRKSLFCRRMKSQNMFQSTLMMRPPRMTPQPNLKSIRWIHQMYHH